MSASPLRHRWLLLVLLLLLPLLALGSGPFDLARVQADEADDEDDGDNDDPFGAGDEDEEDDFFETPTSFTPAQAEKAIQKGVVFLIKSQKEDGSWGDVVGNATYAGGAAPQSQGEHPAGPTALALYTLLKCKVPVRDTVIRKGFEFLKRRHRKPGSSYETSMLLLAVTATANPYKTRSAGRDVERLRLKGDFRRWAQELHEHLLEKRAGQGWRYNVTGTTGSPPGGNQDLSSTQLAALALFAAHTAKIRTPERVWEDILGFSLAQQEDDGPVVVTKDPLTGAEIRRHARGFCYIKGQEHPERGQGTGSMTACGLANVLMARHVLTEKERDREAFEATPTAKQVEKSIDDALAWLEENWSASQNPRKQRENVYHLYWMYAVERAMDLLNRQRIGTHLWYSEMGQQLINTQKEDGSWDSNSTHDPRQVLDTCFALLFLKKATAGMIPVVTGGSDEAPVDNR